MTFDHFESINVSPVHITNAETDINLAHILQKEPNQLDFQNNQGHGPKENKALTFKG